MNLDQRLLAALSAGAPRSARSLAFEMSTRIECVRRRLRELRAHGWPITSHPGIGYRLDPRARVLDPDRVALGLADVADCVDRVAFWPEIDSTQSAIANWPVLDDGRAVVGIADRQTAGHGRRGRAWHAPAGGAITLSLTRYVPQPPARLGPLAPGLGLAAAELLRARGVAEAGVKWPNDVLVGADKLGGVLVDTAAAGQWAARVVVGVGINFDLGSIQAEDGRTDLCSVLSQPAARSDWVAAIVRGLLMRLRQAARFGPTTTLAGWDDLDVYLGQRVCVVTEGEAVEGVAAGVDEGGAFALDTVSGQRRFPSADVSLRTLERC